MRLSIIRVIDIGDLLLTRGWSPWACVVVPLLCSFALVVLLCLALPLCLWFTPSHPPLGSWWALVSRWAYLFSNESSVWQVPGGCDLWEVATVTPLYLHFALTCLLIACFAVNWHLPSILNIAYWQVNLFCKWF